jgi:hypothetical protein
MVIATGIVLIIAAIIGAGIAVAARLIDKPEPAEPFSASPAPGRDTLHLPCQTQVRARESASSRHSSSW